MQVVRVETRREEIEHPDDRGFPKGWVEVVFTHEAVLACGHRQVIAPGDVPGAVVCAEGCDDGVPPPAWEDA